MAVDLSVDLVKTRSLVTPRRYDIAVKWRFFNHLISGDDEHAEEIYRWHIMIRSGGRMVSGLKTDMWKTTPADYVLSARNLLMSMTERGFLPSYAIPVDPNGELLGGAHRVACALALGIKDAPVMRMERYIWAPAWGIDWFRAAGMDSDDLERLQKDMSFLTGN